VAAASMATLLAAFGSAAKGETSWDSPYAEFYGPPGHTQYYGPINEYARRYGRNPNYRLHRTWRYFRGTGKWGYCEQPTAPGVPARCGYGD
jgi:hypothetical protein